MTLRVVPDRAPSGDVHGAFVLMNDIHSLKEAQEALRASESELRLIMDNVPARVAYIDRDYRYRFLNRHNEEWLGLNRNDAHRPAGRRSRRRRALPADAADSRARRARRSRVRRADARAAFRRGSLGIDPLRAEPRRRGPRHRHLRRAHRRRRPEAQRGRAAPRELDAVVAHQQHAARRARVGPGLPPGALVAAGRAPLRLARRRGAGIADRRQSAAPRGGPRRRRRRCSRG